MADDHTTSPELLPCPFCGSAPEFDDWNTSYRPDSKPLWGVVCKSQKCAGEIGFFNADPANAVDDWNTRQPQSPSTTPVSDAMIERMKRIASDMRRNPSEFELSEAADELEAIVQILATPPRRMKAKEEAADQSQPLISDTTDSVIKGSDHPPADEFLGPYADQFVVEGGAAYPKQLSDQSPVDEVDDALTRQLLLDADEMEACGAGNEASNMRKLVARLKEFRAELSAIRNGDERQWTPHLDYSGEPMREGEFRDPPSDEVERQRRISLLDARKSLVTGDDGYVVFWPTSNVGAYASYDLREIADELDKRNASWDAIIQSDPRISGAAIRNTPQAIEAGEVERQARLIFDAMPMRSKTRLYLSDLEEALAAALSTQGEGR